MEELALLLSKAGLQDQYVLVGHSFGGLNMRLFACQHPEHVVGMVLVDAAPEDQRTRLPKLPFMQRMRQQAEWQLFRLRPVLARLGLLRLWGQPNGVVDALPRALQPMARAIGLRSQAYDWLGGEGRAIEQSEAQVRAAGAFPPIPLVVLSAGGDWPQPNLRQAWLELQDELAHLSPHGSHLIAEQSGHYVHLDQPELVVEAIRTVVDRVRLKMSPGEEYETH